MIFTVHCMGWNDRQGIGCQGMGTVRIFMEEMATVSELRERETATNNTPVYIIGERERANLVVRTARFFHL